MNKYKFIIILFVLLTMFFPYNSAFSKNVTIMQDNNTIIIVIPDASIINNDTSEYFEESYFKKIDWALQRQLTMGTLLLGLILGVISVVNEKADRKILFTIYILTIAISLVWLRKFLDYQLTILNNQILLDISYKNRGLERVWNYLNSASAKPIGYEHFLLKNLFFKFNAATNLFRLKWDRFYTFFSGYAIILYSVFYNFMETDPRLPSYTDIFNRIIGWVRSLI